jgi:hypothetical protein
MGLLSKLLALTIGKGAYGIWYGQVSSKQKQK